MKRSWRALVAAITCMTLVFESQPVYALGEEVTYEDIVSESLAESGTVEVCEKLVEEKADEMTVEPAEVMSEEMPGDTPVDINDEASAISGDEIIPDGISVSGNIVSDDEPAEDDEISRLGDSGNYRPSGAPYYFKYETISGDRIKITGVEGTKRGRLVIPDTIDGKPVTEIGDNAFYNCPDFTGNLTIPGSVTIIGDNAFGDCAGFTGALTIPAGVTTIGNNAFRRCRGFEGGLTIPDSVTVIGREAFAFCEGLTGSLTIPSGVTTISQSAFQYCIGLSGNLTIPNGVVTIEEAAFFDCKGFEGGLTIPDSVTTIGTKAFSGCTALTGSLTIPAGVTTIEGWAFWSCRGFTGSLTIPDGVNKIGDSAFSRCSGFTGNLIIPDSVTSIGNNAFMGCSGFTGNLTIPDSVTSIGDEAFGHCSGFTGKLIISESVTTIGEWTFKDCSGFTGNLTIPKSVTTISENAFANCSGFTGNLTISDSVTTIGDRAFSGCSGFTGSLTIPDSVTTIGESAFSDCSGFTGSLIIPDSVTAIGSHAFYDCNGLTGELTIPDNVTTIGGGAFEHCSGFTGSLTIPDSVMTIEEYAFSGCSGFMGSLTIPDSITMISQGTFFGCSGLTGNLTIPDSVATIEDSAFENCSGFTGSLTIPDSVTTIENHAFVNCTGLHRVVNHSNVTIALPAGTDHEVKWFIEGDDSESPITSIGKGTALRTDAYGPSDTISFTHELVDPQTYTGKAIKPDVKVYFGKTLLRKNKDYKITYSNNTNAGKASFIITGKGHYSGKEADAFCILEKSILDKDVSISVMASAVYNKKDHTPVPKITYKGKKLKKGKDFTIAYYTDEDCKEYMIPNAPGTYYVRITGMGNYTGKTVKEFVIVPSGKVLVSKLKIGKIKDQTVSDGSIRPEPVVKNGKTTLEKDVHYTISWGDNKEIGTGTVTITGIEKAGYVGSRTVTFKIKGTSIKKTAIGGFVSSFEYDGTKKLQNLTIKYGDTVLTEGRDYALEYENIINAGTPSVTIKGKGKYTGSLTKKYKIKPYDISRDLVTVSLDKAEYPYEKSGSKPKPEVRFNGTLLTAGTDYTLSYKNTGAVNPGTGNKKPSIYVKGKGNFRGSQIKSFAIVPAKMDESGIKIEAPDIVYKNVKNNWKPKKITVVDKTGKALKAGKDYETGIEYTLDSEGTQPVSANAILDAGTTVYVKVKGKGSYTGDVKGEYRIVKQDISKLKVTLSPKTYTGKEIKLNKSDIRWISGRKTVYGVTFDIDESTYKNNINKGKATVRVHGTGNYGGYKTITYTIGSRGILWWWRNLYN